MALPRFVPLAAALLAKQERHFDYKDWQSYAVQNFTFEKLEH